MISDWPEGVTERLSQLGEPMAEFTVRASRLLRNLVVGSLLSLAGGAIVAVSVAAPHLHHLHIVALGIIMVPAGIMLAVRAYLNRGLRVLVFPEGVVRVRRDQEQTFCWDEIDQVWERKHKLHNFARIRDGSLLFTVRKANGEELNFDDSLPRLKQLGEILKRETLPYLLPRALAAHHAGETVDFGKLQVSAEGLVRDNAILPWRDIREVKLKDDTIIIYKKGDRKQWSQTPLSEISNPHVFWPLVDSALKERNSSRCKDGRRCASSRLSPCSFVLLRPLWPRSQLTSRPSKTLKPVSGFKTPSLASSSTGAFIQSSATASGS